jgi:hypothetical protein
VWIRDALVTAQELWRLLPEADDDHERLRVARAAIGLVHVADLLAVTTRA